MKGWRLQGVVAHNIHKVLTSNLGTGSRYARLRALGVDGKVLWRLTLRVTQRLRGG